MIYWADFSEDERNRFSGDQLIPGDPNLVNDRDDTSVAGFPEAILPIETDVPTDGLTVGSHAVLTSCQYEGLHVKIIGRNNTTVIAEPLPQPIFGHVAHFEKLAIGEEQATGRSPKPIMQPQYDKGKMVEIRTGEIGVIEIIKDGYARVRTFNGDEIQTLMADIMHLVPDTDNCRDARGTLIAPQDIVSLQSGQQAKVIDIYGNLLMVVVSKAKVLSAVDSKDVVKEESPRCPPPSQIADPRGPAIRPESPLSEQIPSSPITAQQPYPAQFVRQLPSPQRPPLFMKADLRGPAILPGPPLPEHMPRSPATAQQICPVQLVRQLPQPQRPSPFSTADLTVPAVPPKPPSAAQGSRGSSRTRPPPAQSAAKPKWMRRNAVVRVTGCSDLLVISETKANGIAAVQKMDGDAINLRSENRHFSELEPGPIEVGNDVFVLPDDGPEFSGLVNAIRGRDIDIIEDEKKCHMKIRLASMEDVFRKYQW
jgi:hypothetical protein